MNQDEMLKEFMRHRDAEIRRDYDAIVRAAAKARAVSGRPG
jgi:hypothetical protein